jgi:hypothetical protein
MMHKKVRWLRTSHVSMLGTYSKQAKAERKYIFWKEGMHEENDSWKKDEHACMHGRPNEAMVMVFVIYCNG